MTAINARRESARRGFAMIVAIALIGVVGLALASILSLSHLDLRRTSEAAQGAQLRQLLVAGERAARDRLNAGDATGGVLSVSLPPALAADGGAMEVRVEPAVEAGAPAVVTVEAKLGTAGLSQTLRYHRGAEEWKLVGAELHRPTATRRRS